ncbi:putative ribonuclease H-like domain-containing protein [Tanacetum coccineum]
MTFKRFDYVDAQGNPQLELQEKGVIDSGCSRHMTGNKSYLTDYEEINGGFVAFGCSTKRGKITRKGKIRTSKLDFEDVYFVKELKFNLFSVSQMCDKKNGVLFTDTECVVLSPDFKLLDESQVLLRVPRKNNMYSVDLKNVVPSGGLTCLFAKATLNESNLWHRRLGHINFKTMNKLERNIKLLVRPRLNRKSNKYRVKIIRCDNGTEFKNKEMNQFCDMKWIKREFSVVRTPQQNGVAERKNRTLIEAARTMLVDSKLPTTFWAEAVNTACYVQNRVLVIKPHNKTLYKLFNGRPPIISFMRPFRCLVTILNTLDHLGKFDGKADEGFFVGYSVNSKAFRVFSSRTRIVEETLHITFLENKPNVAGSTKESIDAGQARKKTVPSHEYILLPLWTPDSPIFSSPKRSDDEVADDVGKESTKDPANEGGKDDQDLRDEFEREFERLFVQGKETEININSTNSIFVVSSPINTAGIKDADDEPMMPNLKDTSIFGGAYDDEDFVAGGDMNNLESSMPVSPIVTTRVHKDHLVKQIIRDLHSAPQIRRMTKNSEEHGLKVWTLVNLLYGKRAIGTKWVYKNKKDERSIVVRNRARMVVQGYTQEKRIDYDEVFALVSRIEAIRLFLAYALFKDFVVYQMDVKSAFLYGKIEEEVYVCQPPGFEDPEFPNRVYKVEKALYGLHQAPRAWIASTPMETSKLLLKDAEAEDVDVHLYRSMIGSLIYLIAFRPDIIYLKGQPKLGLWYPKDSPFDLEAYTDSDYAGASLDRKSTIGGCQFLRSRLISWQCKKQTVVANSTTEAEYVAASNCCGHLLWIQNQMLDYGYNFMNTKIFIDNESTICIVKNPVFHSKTKHIEIRHHFIRDSYEKRLIQVIKIHTDHNVADLLTKAFDVSRFQFLTASIGMLNL